MLMTMKTTHTQAQAPARRRWIFSILTVKRVNLNLNQIQIDDDDDYGKIWIKWLFVVSWVVCMFWVWCKFMCGSNRVDVNLNKIDGLFCTNGLNSYTSHWLFTCFLLLFSSFFSFLLFFLFCFVWVCHVFIFCDLTMGKSKCRINERGKKGGNEWHNTIKSIVCAQHANFACARRQTNEFLLIITNRNRWKKKHRASFVNVPTVLLLLLLLMLVLM